MIARYLRSPISWLAWTGLCVAFTMPALLWHLDFFAQYGPRFKQLFPLLALFLAAGAMAHQYVRRRGYWRYELAGLAISATVLLAAYQPRATLFACLLTVAAFAQGSWTLRKLGFQFKNLPEELALSVATGLEEIGAALFVLGLLKLYYPIVFLLLLVLPCLLFFPGLKRLWVLLRTLHSRWGSLDEIATPFTGIAVYLAAIFAACGVIVVLSPCLVYDSLAYHLADARVFAASHALITLPFQSHSLLPQSFEVLMAAGYSLDGQAAAQMIPPLFFLLTLAIAFAIARRCGMGSPTAVTAVLLAVTVPFIHWEGVEVKNDCALAFLCLCALYGCLRWLESRDFRWIHLSVFFLASAFGIKHIAIFAAIPLGLIYLYALRASSNRIRKLALMILLFTVAGIYWQARTYYLTGNPVYPFDLRDAITIHSGRSHVTAASTVPQAMPAEARQDPATPKATTLRRWFVAPWRWQFRGNTVFETKSPTPLGVLFVLLLPVWLAARGPKARFARNLCWFFMALYFFYWSLEWGLLRFGIGLILLFFIFMIHRAVRIYESAPAATRAILRIGLLYSGLVALSAVVLMEIDGVQLKILTRQMDWTAYLKTWPATYRSLDYLRTQAGPGDLILSVDDCAAAYAPDPVLFNGVCTNDHLYDPREIHTAMAARHYNFLILPRALNIDPGVAPSFEDQRYAVYRLPQ